MTRYTTTPRLCHRQRLHVYGQISSKWVSWIWATPVMRQLRSAFPIVEGLKSMRLPALHLSNQTKVLYFSLPLYTYCGYLLHNQDLPVLLRPAVDGMRLLKACIATLAATAIAPAACLNDTSAADRTLLSMAQSLPSCAVSLDCLRRNRTLRLTDNRS